MYNCVYTTISEFKLMDDEQYYCESSQLADALFRVANKHLVVSVPYKLQIAYIYLLRSHIGRVMFFFSKNLQEKKKNVAVMYYFSS